MKLSKIHLAIIIASILLTTFTLSVFTKPIVIIKHQPRKELISQIAKLQSELNATKLELKNYKADEEYIKSLGAKEDVAKKIIKASGALNVDPK